MSDWLKVYRLAPRVVVMIVNECHETPDAGEFYVRAEARVYGETITARYRQRVASVAEMDTEFAALGAENALHWLRNQHAGWNGSVTRAQAERGVYGRS